MDLTEIGLRYLTASAVQQWSVCPATWVLGSLFGKRDFKVPAVARHMAVRDALRACLHHQDDKAGDDVLIRTYTNRLIEWGIDPASEAARSDEDTLLPLLDGCVKEFQQVGCFKMPLAFRIASSLLVAGIETPLLSVADFVFEHTQVKVKTGKRLPSKIEPRDMAALALDARVRAQHPIIIYVTPKKSAVYEPTGAELKEALDQLCFEAMSLETMLLTAQSPGHALAMLPMNGDHFMWKPQLKVEALKIINQWRTSCGTLCTEIRELREGAGRITHRDLLPDARSWDAEGDVEW
jgi:hypothetical protein